jgi:hypothetical protein
MADPAVNSVSTSGLGGKANIALVCSCGWEFRDAEKIIGLMEVANCRFRDIQLVRQTLKERRPGSIDIELSQEQFERLRNRRQRVQRKR